MAENLRFLLAEFNIPARLQARLGELGCDTMAVFRVVAGDRATLRATLAADLLLDPAADGLTADLQAKAPPITGILSEKDKKGPRTLG